MHCASLWFASTVIETRSTGELAVPALTTNSKIRTSLAVRLGALKVGVAVLAPDRTMVWPATWVQA